MSKSSNYWRKRELEWKKADLKDEAEYIQEIQDIYSTMLTQINKEIESFFIRYSTKEGMSMAEAKRKASDIDIKEYEKKAKKYVKEKDFSKEANEQMRLYNLAMKVNRLELLKANIGLELTAGSDELVSFTKEKLEGAALEQIQRNAGILGDTIVDNAKTAKTIANSSFKNATFSERIWSQQDLLKNDLYGILSTALIQGRNPREFIPKVRKSFDVTRYQAERLLRTELTRVRIQAQAESYEANGIDEYEYVACGLKDVCPLCKELDRQIFKLKDMEPGENAPPRHANCHCSTAPYSDRSAYEKWLNGLANGEHSLRFDEWKENISKMAAESKNDWSKTETRTFSKKEQQEFVNYAKEKGINLVGIKNFDGDPELLKQQIDSLQYAMNKYPLRVNKKVSLTIGNLPDEDFASTADLNITLNKKILRSKIISEKNIVNGGNFASPRLKDIVIHEYGHALSTQYGNRGVEIAKKAYYNLYRKEVRSDEILSYLEKNVSVYCSHYYGDYDLDVLRKKVNVKRYKEITSEILAKNEWKETAFTHEYIRLLLERRLSNEQ